MEDKIVTVRVKRTRSSSYAKLKTTKPDKANCLENG
jgi:hypothetical protein